MTTVKHRRQWGSVRLRGFPGKSAGNLRVFCGATPPPPVSSLTLEPLRHPSFSFEESRELGSTGPKEPTDTKIYDFYSEAVRFSPLVDGRHNRSTSSSYPSVGLRTPDNASPLPALGRVNLSKLSRFNISEIDFSYPESATSLSKPPSGGALESLDEGPTVPPNSPQTETVSGSRDRSQCQTPADQASVTSTNITAAETTATGSESSPREGEGGKSPCLSQPGEDSRTPSPNKSDSSAPEESIRCPPRKSSLASIQLGQARNVIDEGNEEEITLPTQKLTLSGRIGYRLRHIAAGGWMVKKFRELCARKPRTGQRRKLQKKKRPAAAPKSNKCKRVDRKPKGKGYLRFI